MTETTFVDSSGAVRFRGSLVPAPGGSPLQTLIVQQTITAAEVSAAWDPEAVGANIEVTEYEPQEGDWVLFLNAQTTADWEFDGGGIDVLLSFQTASGAPSFSGTAWDLANAVGLNDGWYGSGDGWAGSPTFSSAGVLPGMPTRAGANPEPVQAHFGLVEGTDPPDAGEVVVLLVIGRPPT